MSIIERGIEQSQPVAPLESGDDVELLDRYRLEGDAEAFGRIAHRHAAAVYATCLRVLGDSAAAEDAAQETFYRLLRQPYGMTRNVGAWLHRTATNVALDLRRSDTSRHRRETAYGRAAGYGESADGATGSSRQALTWAELSPSIDQALSEMPEDLREILVEHYLMGRPQAELAAASGTCPATICRRVKQGIEDLRRRLRLKGIDAMPAILAGLLCHVAARQAPTAVLAGVAKMSMLGPTEAPTATHAARSAAKPSIGRAPATVGQQIAAGVFWVGVSLAVVALLLAMAMGIGLGQQLWKMRGGPGSATMLHRAGY